jgi:hypothetical protein
MATVSAPAMSFFWESSTICLTVVLRGFCGFFGFALIA